ncbi:expressed unknown protein [Seminavis robusta]|uniref:Uncharacterized protein n=1 Tax=Seminavis robusta TaxID=568900 RepID=A0A9N8ED31_9STRA|nr:expressed unknown protein [Seminavis robusta]|eukprot:Sro823_g207540.1 n/a (1853) ;mRNA; f:12636-18194
MQHKNNKNKKNNQTKTGAGDKNNNNNDVTHNWMQKWGGKGHKLHQKMIKTFQEGQKKNQTLLKSSAAAALLSRRKDPFVHHPGQQPNIAQTQTQAQLLKPEEILLTELEQPPHKTIPEKSEEKFASDYWSKPSSPPTKKKNQQSTKLLYPPSNNNGTAPFAYAFYLGGIPSQTKSWTATMRKSNAPKKPNKDDYRGLLYNILVSVKLLRDAGSRADFVLLVNMVDAHTELPLTDVRYLQALGIRILYTPSTPDITNEIMTVPFEKFRILDLVQYQRILFLDADITPRCNLDYLMELSLRSGDDSNILQENMLLSMGNTPATGRIFMVTPRPGDFYQFVDLLPIRTRDAGIRMTWNPKGGWGFRPTHFQTLEAPTSIQHGYVFEGGNSDQGMLYEWIKYQVPFRHSNSGVSIVIGPQIQNWNMATTLPDDRTSYEVWDGTAKEDNQKQYLIHRAVEPNALLAHSCLPPAEAQQLAQLEPDRPTIHPQGVAPYQDFELWTYGKSGTYPWNRPMAPTDTSDDSIRHERWFHILKQLDALLDMNLGLSSDRGSDSSQTSVQRRLEEEGEDEMEEEGAGGEGEEEGETEEEGEEVEEGEEEGDGETEEEGEGGEEGEAEEDEAETEEEANNEDEANDEDGGEEGEEEEANNEDETDDQGGEGETDGDDVEGEETGNNQEDVDGGDDGGEGEETDEENNQEDETGEDNGQGDEEGDTDEKQDSTEEEEKTADNDAENDVNGESNAADNSADNTQNFLAEKPKDAEDPPSNPKSKKGAKKGKKKQKEKKNKKNKKDKKKNKKKNDAKGKRKKGKPTRPPVEHNWRYIPTVPMLRLVPMWSEGVKALRQWAYRIVDTSLGYISWEPPTLPESVLLKTADKDLRQKCQCPNTIQLDPCSRNEESMEDWLSRRIPYYLSKQRPLCPRAAKHTMHVVMPFHDLEPAVLESTVCSIACQDYPPEKMSILLYDDGSADPNAVEEFCMDHPIVEFEPLDIKGAAKDPAAEETLNSHAWNHIDSTMSTAGNEGVTTRCVRSKKHEGSSGAAFWSLRMVERLAQPNDVVVMISDGEFNSQNALEIINDVHVQGGGWVGYLPWPKTKDGSVLLELSTDPVASFRPKRRLKPWWRFQYPFTFKAHLLSSVTLKDFTYKGKKFLADKANIGYMIRMLEVAGRDRIGSFKRQIFDKRIPSSVGNAGDADIVQEQLSSIDALSASSAKNAPIHVVMMCSENMDIFTEQLTKLQAQTIARKRWINFHVLCGQSNFKADNEQTVDAFKSQQKTQSFLEGRKPIKVTVVDSSVGGTSGDFERLQYVHQLRQRVPLEYVVLLDSDQYIHDNFLTGMLKNHNPTSITSIYGRSFSPRDRPFHVSFNATQIRLSHLLEKGMPTLWSFVYVNLGGAVFDANLWLLDRQLLRPGRDLTELADASDVWVSFVMDGLLGWNMNRYSPNQLSLFSIPWLDNKEYRLKVNGEITKPEVERIRKLNNKAPPDGTKEQKMMRAFERLQKTYQWNVVRRPRATYRLPDIEPVPIAKNKAHDHRGQTTTDMMTPAYNNNNNNNNNKKGNTKRAFVCVTGQFDRFELRSKIDKLMVPIQKAGYSIDVALVVSNGTAAFTNLRSKRNSTTPFYTSWDRAVNDLQKANVNVVSNDGAYEKLEDPFVPQSYVKLLEFAQNKRTYEEQEERAKNHARIFDSYRRCLEYADQETERVTGNKLNPYYYDVYVRIRDDIGLRRNYDEKAMADAFPPPPNSLIVTPCRSWKGMNDRFAVISPDIARTYFQRPAEYFFGDTRFIYDNGAVSNPETMLLYTYTTAKIHVLGHRTLYGLCRMYKLEASGTPRFLRDDVKQDKCPEPDPYRPRLYQLYGWSL